MIDRTMRTTNRIRVVTLPDLRSTQIVPVQPRRRPRRFYGGMNLSIWAALILCQGGIILALSWLVAQRPNCLPLQQRPAIAKQL